MGKGSKRSAPTNSPFRRMCEQAKEKEARELHLQTVLSGECVSNRGVRMLVFCTCRLLSGPDVGEKRMEQYIVLGRGSDFGEKNVFRRQDFIDPSGI